MKSKILVLLGTILLGWAAAQAETGVAIISATTDTANVSGIVYFEDTSAGLKVKASVEEASTGSHGFHIHEFGSCDDNGNKAGSHYNPKGRKHGHAVKDGAMSAHPGDMGNIEIGEHGTGTLEVVLPGVSLSTGRLNVAGRAVVIHDKADDFGQPVGNAGARIGCGIITITGK